MSVTTIIIIILAIVVLVFLIFSFTRSGGSLMDNIKNFFGGGSNIDSIKNACQTACITKSAYEFNSVQRDVKWDSNTRASATCKELAAGRDNGCVNGTILNPDELGHIEKVTKKEDCLSKFSDGKCMLGSNKLNSISDSQNCLKAVKWVGTLPAGTVESCQDLA